MIVLIGFPELERSLVNKPFTEIEINGRGRFYDDMETMRASFGGASHRARFPRVIVQNLDVAHATWTGALRDLKAAENWRSIPVIGFGFLEDRGDVTTFYSLGGASCIRKPDTYAELVGIVKTAMQYWLNVSILPNRFLCPA